jgi:pimeloyl-ACP methyl ester carboxylesterase
MAKRLTESVRLPLSEGGGLQGYLSHTDQTQNWAVLSVHGFGSVRMGEKPQALEAACARRGWSFAAFDFRGHGESSGTMADLRGSGLLADLEMVRGYFAERGIRRFGLVGSSMGGWASAWFTRRHPEVVPACVLIAPAFDFLHRCLARVSQPERLRWQQTGRLRFQNDFVDTEIGYGLVEERDLFPMEHLACGWSRPLLIFHGVQDDVIPYTLSVSFVEQAACPQIELRLYKDGDHRLLAFKDEMAEAACSFLARWRE